MVTRYLVPLLVALALGSGCGGGKAEAKKAALNPAEAAEEEGAASKPAAKPAAPAPARPAEAAPAPKAGAKELAKPAEKAGEMKATLVADSAAPETETQNGLRRESFSYTGGSRDPFVSLLASAKVGPELPDLILVAVYYDTRNPSRSAIVMREKVGGRKYSMRPGDRLGRIRLSEVRPKDAVFTIDDFGTERQETLTLRKEDKQ